MANLIRGEVPFRAAGLELFLQYKTRELAEMQTALGFHRPDPFQPDLVEEEDVLAHEKGKPKLDGNGQPVYLRRQVLVDADERQRRMVAAFTAAFMNPDPEASLVCFRIGLKPWERQTGTKLTEESFHKIVDAIGLAEVNLLHFKAIQNGSYLRGDEDGGESEGKAASAALASTI